MLADQILRIPLDQPERLFSEEPAARVREYKALAKTWHPDTGGRADVLAHINALKAAADKLKNWRTYPVDDLTPGRLSLRTAHGTTLNIGYLSAHPFGLGHIYSGGTHTTTLLDAAHFDLQTRAIMRMRAVTYKDDRLRKANAGLMPDIFKNELVGDRHLLSIRKRHDQLLLRDVLDHHGGRIDPRHVAWMVSRAYGLVCFLDMSLLVPCDLSPLNLYVCPEHHTLALLGGWWFVYEEFETIGALPRRTLDHTNPRFLRERQATTCVALEQVKALGRELLGDITGAKLQFDRTLPEAMVRWLLLPSGNNPVKEYQIWQDKVLLESFGPRKFLKWNLTEADLYQPAARRAA